MCARCRCARLKEQLAEAKRAEEAQRVAHRANVQKMLEANEALQAQLKELNGVVEDVVRKEIARARPFPGKANPGAARSSRQPAMAKPFK